MLDLCQVCVHSRHFPTFTHRQMFTFATGSSGSSGSRRRSASRWRGQGRCRNPLGILRIHRSETEDLEMDHLSPILSSEVSTKNLIYWCLLMFIDVYWCLLMFIGVLLTVQTGKHYDPFWVYEQTNRTTSQAGFLTFNRGNGWFGFVGKWGTPKIHGLSHVFP